MELIAIIVLLVLLLFGEIGLYQRKGLKGLSYRCGFSRSELTEGETLEWTETVVNAKALPVPWLKAESTVPKWLYVPEQHSTVTGKDRFITSFFSVRGNAGVSRVWKLRCEKRGVYQVERVVLVTSDLLGAVSLSLPASDTGGTITVLPRRYTQAGLLLPGLFRQFGDFSVRHSLQVDPCLSVRIRSYVPGDPIHRMHWKASAHTGTLLMRQEQYTAQQTICVLLSLETNAADSGNVTQDLVLLEHTIRVCAQCLWELCQNGWLVQLFVGERSPLRMPYASRLGGGAVSYHRMLSLLACLPLERIMPLQQLLPYGTVGSPSLLITPNTDEKTARWKRETKSMVVVTGHAHDFGNCADRVVPAPERGGYGR